MRLDSHQHFWQFDPVRDTWIDDSMKVIQRDFLPEDLEPHLLKNKIDGCIAVQADESEKETNFLLSLAAKNPFIKGVVGWVDLKAPKAEERLAHFSTNKLFKGVRLVVQAKADNFMLGEKFQNGIALLEKFNLTYDILVFPSQLPAAILLAKKFPNQKFVVDHIAKPLIKDKKIRDWQKNIEILAGLKNVFCKVSGLVTEADWNNWKTEEFTPYLDIIFNAFGTERTMYGSDWPVCLIATEYHQQLSIIESYISKFSGVEQDNVMGLNACSFYNL